MKDLLKVLLIIVLAGFCIAQTASADNLKLPIKDGSYMLDGHACPKQPSDDAFLEYGLSYFTSNIHPSLLFGIESNCAIIKVTRNSNAYNVKAGCGGTIYSGDILLAISVKNDVSFSLKLIKSTENIGELIKNKEGSYHYCK